MFLEEAPSEKYRLVTRSDFDGLVCAFLLKQLELINEIKFVHPKDMQDGKIEVSTQDITTNVPYVKGVGLAFDHHNSETIRNQEVKDENYILDPNAPSTARVVYNYYGAEEAFPFVSNEMMAAVDKSDSAQFTIEEVLYPQDWVLLSFLMDARTGLGRFKDFRISNYELMMQLIHNLQSYTIAELLVLPDVKDRVELYFEQEDLFKKQVRRCATVRYNLVILDLRQEEVIHAGNRFIIYALYPECNISIHILPGRQNLNTVFAIGKSIFDRSSKTNVGELALKYGGGGHIAAGTCQVDNAKAETVLQELIDQINADG